MHPDLKQAFAGEMELAKAEYRRQSWAEAFSHLERAHVLGQCYVVAHTASHYWMLKVGLKTRNVRGILGQLLRIPAGAIGSAIGVVPVGNTGGANVGAFRAMPIPDDLQRLLDLDRT